MDEIPVGIELDRAVAMTMGWTIIPPTIALGIREHLMTAEIWVRDEECTPPRAYSTCPGFVSEMMMWLCRESDRNITIWSYATGRRWGAYAHGYGYTWRVDGASLSEAVARLVVRKER